MKKTTINGKMYIALGDFDALRRNCVKDIYDNYERDEEGKLPLTEFDRGRVEAYTHIMTEIMYEEVHAAESPDEIRALHNRLRKEWMFDKFVIVGNDDGENMFYRKECCVGENGEEKPVFTSKARLAMAFDDYYVALCTLEYLKKNVDVEMKIDPLYLHVMTNDEAKKLLEAIFRNDEPEYHGDGTKAEDEDWDGDD